VTTVDVRSSRVRAHDDKRQFSITVMKAESRLTLCSEGKVDDKE